MRETAINTTHNSLTNNLFILSFRLKSQWFIASEENVQGRLWYNKVKSRSELRDASPRSVGGHFLCVNKALFQEYTSVTGSGGSLSHLLSAPLGEKQGVCQACDQFFYSSKSFTNGWLLPGNNIKTKRNTFCVTCEPHLLVIITKAYVSGFYIHITSSGLHIHTWVIQGQVTFYKRQRKWQEACSVHIYNIITKCVKSY